MAKAGAERRQKAHPIKRTKSPSSCSTSTESSAELSSRSASPTSSSDDELIVYSSLAESRDSYAHAFFVSAYVLGPRDPRTDNGFLELLPLLFDRLAFEPVLSSSLAVLSHCYFGAWHRHIRSAENLTVQQSYSKALTGLRRALQDPRHCASDEILMAVCLLNFYEVQKPRPVPFIYPLAITQLTIFLVHHQRFTRKTTTRPARRWCNSTRQAER